MIKAKDAIRVARSLIGTPYSELDCINLIKKVIRTAPGGVPGYTTAGTNALWRSYDSAPKYKDLTWRQMGIAGAKPGMLAFKIDGSDVHHVGVVTENGTVIHASSVYGQTTESRLDNSWHALAIHRYIEAEKSEETPMQSYRGNVKLNDVTSSVNVRNGPGTDYKSVGKLHHDTPVIVQAQSGDWLYITYGDNGLGYIHKDYVVENNDPVENEPLENLEQFTTLVKADGTTIRLEGAWRVAED